MRIDEDFRRLGLPAVSVQGRETEVVIAEKLTGIPHISVEAFGTDVADILATPQPELKIGSITLKPNNVFEFTDNATGEVTSFRAEDVSCLTVGHFRGKPTANDIRIGLTQFPHVLFIISSDGLLSIELEKA